MGPELDLLAWRGHRYDVRTLGASFEYLALQSETDRATAAGRDASMVALLALDAHEVVLAQARDVHEVVKRHPDGDVCSCGLVVPPGLPALQATGHLDQRRWQPTRTILLTSAQRGFEVEPATAAAGCQACGWASAETALADARRSAVAHRCPRDVDPG